MRTVIRLLWSTTAVMVVLGVAAVSTGVASAQKEGASSVSVDRVDARGGEVLVEGSLIGGDLSQLQVLVDGKATEATRVGTLAELGSRNDVVAVIDNAAALGNATVQLAKDALAPIMPGTGNVSSLGVVSTGGKATVEVGPTSSDAAVSSGIAGLDPLGQSYTWDSLARAAALLEDRAPGTVGTVVLFTGTPSVGGTAEASIARTALHRAGVRLAVVAMPGANTAELDQLVGDLGGSLTVVDDDEGLAGAFEKVGEALAGRFRMTIPAPERGDGSVVPLELRAGKAATEVAFTPGADRVGSVALAPVSDGGGSGGFLANPVVKWFALLLVAGSIITLVWVVLAMVLPSETNLVSRLEVYEESYGADAPEELGADDAGHASVPIIRRAVELTGEMAERRGFLDKVEVQLERANLPLRAAEALFFTAVATLLVAVVAFLVTGNVLMGLVTVALGVAVPIALLNFRIRTRRKAFVGMLPDMLTLLAGTLKAGYSISQGFESVSKEIDEPMGRELRRVVTESRLGRPLEESLEAVAERMDSDDFAWAVMAIKIQREVGGNLAELLLTVADTMTQRERLRRDVATLTAEGRMSAIIIGLLPPGLAAALYVMNPDYISELFKPGLGYGLIVGALVMMGIGFAWMKKTITIEV